MFMSLRALQRQLIYKRELKTHSSECSLVVTHLTTNLPIQSLRIGRMPSLL